MQLTVREVAGYLNVPERTIYRWINKGELPAYRINEQYRFHRAEVLEWATAKKIGVSTDMFEDHDAAGGRPVSLSAAVETGGIVHGLRGEDRNAVLRAALDAMPLPESADKGQLLQVLIAREGLASTGIGDGIAIPHVRNPIVLHVVRPTITLCFLERPVDFGALDNRPVHCLFVMVSPTVRDHLQLLSRLAFALRDPGVREALARQGRAEEILAELRRVEGGLAGEGTPPRD